MKRIIKSATGSSKVKITYIHGLNTNEPELRSMSVSRNDTKEALLVAVEHIDISSLEDELNDVDEISVEDIIDTLVYENGSDADSDYIVLLTVSGQTYIDNTYPEENY